MSVCLCYVADRS